MSVDSIWIAEIKNDRQHTWLFHYNCVWRSISFLSSAITQFKSLSQYEKVPKEYKSKDSPSSSGLFQKNEKGQYNAATIVLIVFLVLIVVALIIAIIAVAVSPAGSACSCGPATTLGQGLANVVTSGQINSLVQYADKLKQKQYNAVTGNVTGNAVQYAPTFQPNAAPAVTNVPSMRQPMMRPIHHWLQMPYCKRSKKILGLFLSQAHKMRTVLSNLQIKSVNGWKRWL